MQPAAVGGREVGGRGSGVFRGRQESWPALRDMAPMPTRSTTSPDECGTGKPISVGSTVWLWQRREQTIAGLAQRLGVTLRLTQHIHGLRREIDGRVSGKAVDRFSGEFGRRC